MGGDAIAFQVAIVGLNKVGGSIGLALAAYPDMLICVGYDEDPQLARAAAKQGAITKSYLTLHRCVQESKVIFLACPIDDLKENLQLIAAHAPKGAVVIDTSSNKTRVAGWAQEILPDSMHFMGWTLALNPGHLHDPELGLDVARADLFADSLIGINDPPGTPEAVLTLNVDLVSLLDAKPYLVDSVEADGLIAMGHQLPRLAALALLLATVDSPGWAEARKLAGPDFAQATLPILNVGDRDDLGLGLRLNKDNLIRLVDDLSAALGRIREHLDMEDADALKKDIAHAIDQRLLWLEQRNLGSWTAPENSHQIGRVRPSLLGNWLDERLRKGKDT